MRRAANLAMLVAILFSSGTAWADDEPSADEGQPEQREEQTGWEEYVEVRAPYAPTSNTIATKLPVASQLTPASVGAVGQPLMLEQDAVVLGDALKNVSGLNVQTGFGVFDVFLIRGFDSLSSSLVMTDGAPEPEASFYHLYNVEGVEVLKGPSGVFYGSNPLSGILAGVVNIVRKQPAPANFFRFAGSAGSFGTAEGAVDWNASRDDGVLSFRLNGLWHESDNYRDDKESRHLAINPSFAWRPDDTTSLTVNLEYVDAEYSPDNGIPLLNGEIPDVPRKRSYQSPVDFSDQKIGRVQVDFQKRISDRWTLRNKTYYRDLDWETDGTVFNGVVPNIIGSFDVLRTLTFLDDRQTFTGNQFEAIVSLGGGRVEHTLLAGVEVARLENEFDIQVLPPPNPFAPPGLPFMPTIDLFNPVETFTGVVATFPLQAGDARATVLAPYLIDQLKLSEQFEVLLGARFDSIDYEDDANSFSRNDNKLSPMAGLVYAPADDVSLYFNAARSFAPPSPRVIDPDRRPEESQQLEIGVKKLFAGGKLRTTFAVYQLERENIAIPDDTGVFQQLGDQRSRGFEFELAAEPLPRLRTFFSYAYNDAELTEFMECDAFGINPATGDCFGLSLDRSGNTPAFAPEHLLGFWISRSFEGGLGVAGGGRYIDEQFIAEDNVFAIDSALVLDAAVFYDFEHWRLSVNVKNLTDEDYETRGFGSVSVVPAPPAAVFVGFGFRS